MPAPRGRRLSAVELAPSASSNGTKENKQRQLRVLRKWMHSQGLTEDSALLASWGPTLSPVQEGFRDTDERQAEIKIGDLRKSWRTIAIVRHGEQLQLFASESFTSGTPSRSTETDMDPPAHPKVGRRVRTGNEKSWDR